MRNACIFLKKKFPTVTKLLSFIGNFMVNQIEFVVLVSGFGNCVRSGHLFTITP